MAFRGNSPFFAHMYVIATAGLCNEQYCSCRECFVNTDETHTIASFVKAASRVHPSLHFATVSKTAWGLYMFTMGKEFQASATYKVLTLATCVGRQPDSNIWVLGPTLQVDDDGCIIPREQHQFLW